MRALVTGAGGFAGQHLIRELLDRGDDVVGGVLTGDPPRPDVLDGDAIAQVRWVSLDVTSATSLRAALRGSMFDRVYHLAGQSSVGGSFADPMGTWEVNATGTLRLLEALREDRASRGADAGAEVRVLVVSSAEVYGSVPEARQPIHEDEPLRPVTPYGASKMAAEAAALQAAASRGMHVVVSRSFNHAGPGQDERFALPSMARQLVGFEGSSGTHALRVGNLEPLRDFLDVRDVASAYLTLLERGESGGVYNVASGTPISMLDLVQALVRASGTGAVIEPDPARFRPVEIPLLVGDPTRLRALGWAPEIPLERTVADLLASLRGARDVVARNAAGARSPDR